MLHSDGEERHVEDDSEDGQSDSCSPLGNRRRVSPFVYKNGVRRLRRTAAVLVEEMRTAEEAFGSGAIFHQPNNLNIDRFCISKPHS